ncbi:MAG: zinc metalloprotease HtpX [Candidatus Nanoarchaeia archaeon]|nr:zinc metalloprotease HtpX [Candidatus Nanoarchaeia archaeon]
MAVKGLFKVKMISSITLVLVFGLIAGLLGFILWISGAEGITGIVLALAFSIGLMFFQWYFAPSILKSLMRLQPMDKEEYKEIYNMTKELCKKAGLKLPKMFIVRNPTPNAFTFGRSQKDSYLALHTGLIETLDKSEIKAVIGHELGHIKHRDYIVMTIASILPILLYYLAIIATPNRRDRSGSIFLVYAGAMAARMIGQLLVLWLSRRREYYADAFSADITNPSSMANALEKISYGLRETKGRRTDSAIHSFYIEAPNSDEDPRFVSKIKSMSVQEAKGMEKAHGFLEIFMTHPLTFKRVIALKKLEV